MKDQTIPKTEPIETVEFDRFHHVLDVDHDHVQRGQDLDLLLRDLRRQPKLLRRHDEVFLQNLRGQHAVPVVERRLDDLLGAVAFVPASASSRR